MGQEIRHGEPTPRCPSPHPPPNPPPTLNDESVTETGTDTETGIPNPALLAVAGEKRGLRQVPAERDPLAHQRRRQGELLRRPRWASRIADAIAADHHQRIRVELRGAVPESPLRL